MNIETITQNAKSTITNFIDKNPNWIVIIRWATATWKTKLSVLLSKFFDIEIISADSRQFFREMNIGTDKIESKITEKIPHHQIDIINPDEHYTAWQRKKDVEQQISKIQKKWKIPFIVGWTGLYIDTLYKNFSIPDCPPDYKFREKLFQEEKEKPWILYQKLKKIDTTEAQKIHPNSTRHIIRALEIYKQTWQAKSKICKENPVNQPILMIWLRRDKESTNKLIDKRIKQMLNHGLIKEVQNLLKKWYKKNLQSMQWIGYKETIKFLEWKINLEELEMEIQNHTHHLAKKQRTRFRRYIKDAQGNPKKNVQYKIYEL